MPAGQRFTIFVFLSVAWAQSGDYERGVALVQQAKAAEAVPFLERAAGAEPGKAGLWKALGVAYAAQGMYDLAQPQFHKACALDAKVEDACYFEARALYALDRFEASIAVLKRLPDSWMIELAMGQANEGLGNAGAAEEEFRKSRMLGRDAVAQPEVALGLFLVRQGRSVEAVLLLEDTVRRFPGNGEAQMHLGRALLEQDRFAEAIPYLERAVKALPGSAQARLLLDKAHVRSAADRN